MFQRVLIANRGEIACRIARSCRRLGVESVAVYSEADADALHVRSADRALPIGGARPQDSYLSVERIVAAARECGAEAVHPGYGFLSESPVLARACAAAGVAFVGPDAETIELMGSKAAAKAHMAAAGVPLLPGYHDEDQSDQALQAAAREIGFPLMLKAAAGGGGKGMRIVHAPEGFAAALAAARREAANAFGDERMIIERYLEAPRHLEVQVFGDRHGNLLHLFERDCSSQRRYQKIIEEAPAPALRPAQRERLWSAAVRAARAVNYVNAGTVEFIVGRDGEPCFMEMNTRLQVEHPVTEAVTGVDLVEWQLRVAAGEPLPLSQEQLHCRGHALEARIYAEDPARGFLPASGTVRQLALPSGARVDSGIEAGSVVTVHYDPLLAKIVVKGEDRRQALAALQEALARTALDGPASNVEFLQALVHFPRFRNGAMHTAFLDEALEEVLPERDAPDPELLEAGLLASLLREERTARQRQAAGPDPGNPWAIADAWRPGGPGVRVVSLGWKGEHLRCEARGHGGRYRLRLPGGRIREVLAARQSEGHLFWRGPEGSHGASLLSLGTSLVVSRAGRREVFRAEAAYGGEDAVAATEDRIAAPMPGRVAAVRVAIGAEVSEGQELLVLEAMKMELSLGAPRDGVVAALPVAAGEFVEAEAVLLELAPAAGDGAGAGANDQD